MTYAPIDFVSSGDSINTASCLTGGVNTAQYNFDLSAGGNIAGNAAVIGGGTDPTDLMGSGPLDIINNGQTGGGRRNKRKKSRRLKRSNRTRLNSRSKKSKSKSRSKVKKVRRSLSKRSRKNKRKSKRSKRSLR